MMETTVSKVFPELSIEDVHRLMSYFQVVHVTTEPITVQGDMGGDLFLVVNGTIVAKEEEEEVPPKYFSRGQVFGDDLRRPAYPQQYAATTRAVDPTTTNLLKLNAKDVFAVVGSMRDRQAAQALIATGLFRDFSNEDYARIIACLQETVVSPNVTFQAQGQPLSHMYIVRSGHVHCLDETTGRVLKECFPGDAIGLYAMACSSSSSKRPHLLTERTVGVQPTVLYKLNREDFWEAVQDSDIFQLAKHSLQEYLEEATAYFDMKPLPLLWKNAQDLIVAYSKPKKKPVSLHSMATTFSLGIAVAFFVTLLAPTTVADLGVFRILDLRPGYPMTLIRSVSLCMVGCAVLGYFRIPVQAPPIRRKLFQTTVWLTVGAYVLADSNLAVLDGNALNAFCVSNGSAVVVFLTVAACCTASLQFVYEAMAGSEKGRETVPLMQPRWLATTTAVLIYLFTVIFYVALTVPSIVSQDEDQWVSVYRAFLDSGNAGLAVNGFVMMQVFMVSVSFLMTLLLQKRITSTTAFGVIGLSYVLFLWDASTTTIALAFDTTPEAQDVFSFLLQHNLRYPAVPVALLALVGTCALAVYSSYSDN
jgi:CRP-like cAMP-binding protein